MKDMERGIERRLARGEDLYTDESGCGLLCAVCWGKTAIVEAIAQRQLIKDQLIKGLNILHWAAAYDQTEVASLLLRWNKSLLNSKDEMMGQTPLFWAIRQLKENATALLLDQEGIDVNQADGEGGTALMLACRDGFQRGAELLLQHPATVVDLNWSRAGTALHFASGWGHEAIVKQLIQHHANINSVNESGETPLYKAANFGRDKVISALLDSPMIAVNQPNKYGDTALQIAG